MAGDFFADSAPLTWEAINLGEVVRRGGGQIQTGPFGSQLHASDYVPIGTPFIMPVNIGDNRIIEEGIARITEEDANRLNRHRIKAGDIIYSRRGDVERRALMREEQEGWICGSGCLMVRVGEGVADPVFTSYYLAHPMVREWIVRHAVGATMPNLNTSIMEALPFRLPPTPEQRAIAHILGTLDDKIDLNRRMNATLEEMARALFKSWFVHFDPVRAKMEGRDTGLPAEIADLFPDGFEESELGEVPRGWKASTVTAIASTLKDPVMPGTFPTKVWEHYSIPAFDTGRVPALETGDAIKSGKYRVPATCVLVSKLNPQFPRVWYPNVQDEEAAICSTEFIPFVPRHAEWRPYLYEMMRSDSMQAWIAERVTGSTGSRQRAKPDDIASIPIVVSPQTLIHQFCELVSPMLARVAEEIHESRTLAALRDALLPKLISGEMRVGDAERFVSEVLP